jgi:hypothetical protein
MSRETNVDDSQRLDGNAAAGLLREVFAVEMTTTISTCAGCGKSGPIGELMMYGGEMGVILRCPGCDTMLICLSQTPEGYWLDMRGAQVLRFAPGR